MYERYTWVTLAEQGEMWLGEKNYDSSCLLFFVFLFFIYFNKSNDMFWGVSRPVRVYMKRLLQAHFVISWHNHNLK